METLYQDGRVRLWEENGELRFRDGTADYVVTSYPYEPCLYLTDGSGRRIVVHNSFESDWIASVAREGGTLRSLSGHEYDIAGLCALLRIAAGEGVDMNIDDVERLYAEEEPDYCIPLKDGPLRARIVEMMEIAGDGPERRQACTASATRFASMSVKTVSCMPAASIRTISGSMNPSWTCMHMRSGSIPPLRWTIKATEGGSLPRHGEAMAQGGTGVRREDGSG